MGDGNESSMNNYSKSDAAEINKVMRSKAWRDFRCPPGSHKVTEGSFPCVQDPIRYGMEQRVDGIMSLAFEHRALVPANRVKGAEDIDEFWLSFADPRLADCIEELSAPRSKPLRAQVSLIGKAARGGQYGHLAGFRGEIQVQRFLSGDPCEVWQLR